MAEEAADEVGGEGWAAAAFVEEAGEAVAGERAMSGDRR